MVVLVPALRAVVFLGLVAVLYGLFDTPGALLGTAMLWPRNS